MKFSTQHGKSNQGHYFGQTPCQPDDAKKPYFFPSQDSGKLFVHNYQAWEKEQKRKIRKYEGLTELERSLVDLVESGIKNNPITRENRDWAAFTLKSISESLGVSEKTVQRMIERIPLCKTVKQIDGSRFTLLRVGNPAHKSPEDFARIMALFSGSRRGSDGD